MFRAVPGSGPLISWLWFACHTLSEIALCDLALSGVALSEIALCDLALSGVALYDIALSEIALCDIMYLCDIALSLSEVALSDIPL